MTTERYSATDIAHFLQDNPQFFSDYADVFADLKVPHPNQARAISLGERQVMTLRAKAKDLDRAFAILSARATDNEKISRKLATWCTTLLAEPQAEQLPQKIVDGLKQQFGLSSALLRLWSNQENGHIIPENLQATEAMQELAKKLNKPYCGTASKHQAQLWFDTPPQSLGIIALKPQADAAPYGLLLLASDNAERFSADMATDFLEIIARLSHASLQRWFAATPKQPL